MESMYKITRELHEDAFSDEGNHTSYHSRNTEGHTFRTSIAHTPNRSSKLSYSAELIEVHHGTIKHHNKGGYPATLIILEFRFQSKHHSRRYKSVEVDVKFQDEQGKAHRDPEVVAIAPERVYYLNRTIQRQMTAFGAQIGATLGVGGLANVETGGSWEFVEEKFKEFKVTLTGERRCGGCRANPNRRNALQWSMAENPNARDGIPTFLQTAILLKRHGRNDPFTCQLSVKSEVDTSSKILRVSDGLSDVDKVIDPITVYPAGPQLQNNQATGIQREDLEHMERLVGNIGTYCKVGLSQALQPGVVPSQFPSQPPAEPPAFESPLDRTDSGIAMSDNGSQLTKTPNEAVVPEEMPNGMSLEDAAEKHMPASMLSLVILTAQEAAAAAVAAARAAAKAMEAATEAAEAASRAANAARLAEAASRIANQDSDRDSLPVIS